MPFTGGWWGRKSPPRQVSVKWSSGESFSPFTFTAPLMPPCAHTECERLTGTIENRSTATPASASLSVAMSPASPPPTTATRGGAISASPRAPSARPPRPSAPASAHHDGVVRLGVWLLQEVEPEPAEPEQRRQAQRREARRHQQAHAGGRALRPAAGHDPPEDREPEQAVPEVVAGGQNAQHVERQHRRVLQVLVHVAVGARGLQVLGLEIGRAHV